MIYLIAGQGIELEGLVIPLLSPVAIDNDKVNAPEVICLPLPDEKY